MIYPAYCFTRSLPAIRVKAPSRDYLVFFNDVVRFGDQYIARQIEVKKTGNPELTIHVTELESVANMAEAVFVPPADAVPAPPRKITVSPGVIAGSKVSGERPQYPYEAKVARIQGVVILEATITKTGTIGELQVASGHPLLQQAALDAVKTWRYKPYLLNGEAVEVETQIDVIFQLGN
jgi:TonB family protein